MLAVLVLLLLGNCLTNSIKCVGSQSIACRKGVINLKECNWLLLCVRNIIIYAVSIRRRKMMKIMEETKTEGRFAF